MLVPLVLKSPIDFRASLFILYPWYWKRPPVEALYQLRMQSLLNKDYPIISIGAGDKAEIILKSSETSNVNGSSKAASLALRYWTC